jgi:hypothetical protein
MPFECREATTRYARTSPVSPNATNNTVLQVVIWYIARILAFRVSALLILLFANTSPYMSLESNLLWYRVVVSLINYETFQSVRSQTPCSMRPMIDPVTMMVNKIKLASEPSSRRRRHAPVAVENPRAFLALFAAVLGTSAAAALSKLARVLFPPTALVVCTLSDASP